MEKRLDLEASFCKVMLVLIEFQYSEYLRRFVTTQSDECGAREGWSMSGSRHAFKMAKEAEIVHPTG